MRRRVTADARFCRLCGASNLLLNTNLHAQGTDLGGSRFRFALLDSVQLDARTVVGAGTDFAGASLQRVEMPAQIRLVRLVFKGANLSRIVLDECCLESADLCNATLAQCSLRGAQLSQALLSGADVSEAMLQGVVLTGGCASGASFARSQMQSASFADCNAANAIWDHCACTKASFDSVNLTRASFRGATLQGCRFTKCVCASAILAGADLAGAHLSDCSLADADLSNANLRDATLSGCDLQRAVFTHACLAGCDLSHAKLQGALIFLPAGADGGGANADCSDPLEESPVLDLRSIRLQGAQGLVLQHLRHANLSNADLRGLSLERCDLSSARLLLADFSGCDLRFANLSNSNLEGAIFQRALLVAARLDGARATHCNFALADLHDAKLFVAPGGRGGGGGDEGQLADGIDLSGALGLARRDFSGCVFKGCDLSGCDLSQTKWANASLQDCNLAASVLDLADLKGVSVVSCSLEGASLERAFCKGAHLTAVVLKNASLRQADVRKAKVHKCVLVGVGLQEAKLSGTDFSSSDLRWAVLVGTNLSHADLRGARISNVRVDKTTNFEGTHFLLEDLIPDDEAGVNALLNLLETQVAMHAQLRELGVKALERLLASPHSSDWLLLPHTGHVQGGQGGGEGGVVGEEGDGELTIAVAGVDSGKRHLPATGSAQVMDGEGSKGTAWRVTAPSVVTWWIHSRFAGSLACSGRAGEGERETMEGDCSGGGREGEVAFKEEGVLAAEASAVWGRLKAALKVVLTALVHLFPRDGTLTREDVTALGGCVGVAHELCRRAPAEAREAVAATFSCLGGVDSILRLMMALGAGQQELVTQARDTIVLVLGLELGDKAQQHSIRSMLKAATARCQEDIEGWERIEDLERMERHWFSLLMLYSLEHLQALDAKHSTVTTRREHAQKLMTLYAGSAEAYWRQQVQTGLVRHTTTLNPKL